MNQDFDSNLVQQMVDTRLERREIPNGDKLAETMTKREAFALAAMQGFAAAPPSWDTAGPEKTASLSVDYADALLAELEKRNG